MRNIYKIRRKIRNVILLGIMLLIMLGVYYNVLNSKAEKVQKITATAVDLYNNIENEEFELEAREINNSEYEIELPDNVNTKKVNSFYKISNAHLQDETLDKKADKKEGTIRINKEDLQTNGLVFAVDYNFKILSKNSDGKWDKKDSVNMSDEERNSVALSENNNIIAQGTAKLNNENGIIDENTTVLYNKILEYTDEKNGKNIKVAGYMPRNAELQVVEQNKEEIGQIITDKTVEVAYDIKVVIPVTSGDGTISYTEVEPISHEEKYQVSIQDASVNSNSQVYHVKDDNSTEQIQVEKIEDDQVIFNADDFSIYAVVSEAATAAEGVETQSTTDAGIATQSEEINYLRSTISETLGDHEFLNLPGTERRNISSVTFCASKDEVPSNMPHRTI